MKIPHRLLTATDAAALLGVSRMTLHRWRKAGMGPRLHDFGGRKVYLRSEVEAYKTGGKPAKTAR